MQREAFTGYTSDWIQINLEFPKAHICHRYFFCSKLLKSLNHNRILRITIWILASPQAELKVLGVIVDRQLRWGPQIKHAVFKEEAVFNALSKITSSVSVPSIRKSRLIYSAVARPMMLYESQIRGFRNDSKTMSSNMINKLPVVQNQCLRKIICGYKRTLISVLEREAGIAPFDIHNRSNIMIYGKIT
ncbi:hypothetical protein Golomagni_05154 [Golovinomyces magnicellulatus]|nr:hypothetical protein Golomagni_05154 [Golovinomyces magnicellulatus]